MRSSPKDSDASSSGTETNPRQNPDVTATFSLPGFVDAHSQASSAPCAGRSAGADFWAWRETMLAEAVRQTPATIRTEYELTYSELLAAGYTAVGEFHYLGFEEALAAADAAAAAGIEIVVLHAAYGRGGVDRFRQPSVSAYLAEVESARRARDPRRPRAALRPCLPEGLAGRDRPLRGNGCSATPRPRMRAATRDRGVPRRAPASADRAPGRDRMPRATHDRHPRDARSDTSSTWSPAPAPACASARRPRRISAMASPRCGACSSEGSRSASAPTRTSASIRSRSSLSSTASHGARPCAADVLSPDALLEIGGLNGAGRARRRPVAGDRDRSRATSSCEGSLRQT